MNLRILLSSLLTFLLLTAFRSDKSALVQLLRLRCELLTNPKGIDATVPRLSWELCVPRLRPEVNRLLGAGGLYPREAGRRRRHVELRTGHIDVAKQKLTK
jgi:hypothetical protein